MAKQIKDKWLGARVDAAMDKRVAIYTEQAEMNMGDLVRLATEEYMLNHPLPDLETKVKADKVIKPGE